MAGDPGACYHRYAAAHVSVVMVGSEKRSLIAMCGGTPAFSVSTVALNALPRTLAGDVGRTAPWSTPYVPGWTATDMGGRGRRPVAESAASIRLAADLTDDRSTGTCTRDGGLLPGCGRRVTTPSSTPCDHQPLRSPT